MFKGRKHTEETRQKIGLALNGIKRSVETRQKISLARTGIKFSDEHKKKISEANKGEKASNWKGGITNDKDYQKKYLQNIRNAVLEALGGVCIECGFADKRALQIDHIKGGGSKERKMRGFNCNFHKHVLKSFEAKENKYQLLCANCNWIKRFINNETKFI